VVSKTTLSQNHPLRYRQGFFLFGNMAASCRGSQQEETPSMKPLPYFLQSRLLRSAPGVYHAFGGVDPVEGRGQRELLAEAFSISPEAVGALKQVHSADVLEFDSRDADVPGGWRREGDGLWSAVPGTGVGVRTADCVPILLAHPEVPLVAAVHAGWRGLASGIVREAVRVLAERVGGGDVSGLTAAAGPCARACCYEVGEETAEALSALPGAALRRGDGPEKWYADLQAIALSELARAGIPPFRAEGVGPCTVCSNRFHSYRREKSLTGRQFSLIYIYRDLFRRSQPPETPDGQGG
jgi:YfiH family protein